MNGLLRMPRKYATNLKKACSIDNRWLFSPHCSYVDGDREASPPGQASLREELQITDFKFAN
jgi:hypothetical protein